LFIITQRENEGTKAYLNRFSEEMLKVEGLLELIVIITLIHVFHNLIL
jgi:hypothetical protein